MAVAFGRGGANAQAEAAARARAARRVRARGLEARGDLGRGAAAQRRGAGRCRPGCAEQLGGRPRERKGGGPGLRGSGPAEEKGQGDPFKALNFKQFSNEFGFGFE